MGNLYSYTQESGFVEIPASFGSDMSMFLYEDQFFIVDGLTGLERYNIRNFQPMEEVDFGTSLGQMEGKFAVTSSGELLYFSMYLEASPEYRELYSPCVGTYCIDTETWTATQVDDTFHSCLIYGAAGLYTVASGTVVRIA